MTPGAPQKATASRIWTAKSSSTEDNPGNRELIREFLEIEGYEVLEAANGLEALEQIEEKSPDLVLMDIQVPLIDGLEAVSKLRRDARFAKLPVIALTAYAMSGD